MIKKIGFVNEKYVILYGFKYKMVEYSLVLSMLI